jgi:ornithine cyclodeaminase
MSSAIDAVRDGLQDLEAGQFEQPVRTVMGDGGLLIMSTHHRRTATAIVKTLSLNFERDPAICGTVAWADMTSTDTLVADAAAVTALRTGAISGVATDLLAAPDADTLTIIGTGAQAPDQVRAVHDVRPLRKVNVVGRNELRARSFADGLRAQLPGTEVVVTGDPATACAESGIICCATSATDPVLASDWLPDRVHVNAIGSFRPSMRELPDDLLGSGVVVDDLPAVLQESGEIQHALGSGVLARNQIRTLGAALRSPVPAGRTVFKSVGVAAQDWAIARLLAEQFLT